MAGTWINRVRHVSDGEPVNGAIDSRPTRALEGNSQYLKNRIDAAELGESVCAYGETVKSDVLVGMAVYRNNVDAQYERALAAVDDVVDENGEPTGVFAPSASSDTIGIVVFKHNATKADILLAGRRRVDISLAVDGTVVPGRYYLSSAEPGMLVQQRPPVSVSVLVYTDDGIAIVQPIQRDFLEDHIHYKILLHARPAGGNTLVFDGISETNRHVIDPVDPSLPGWLPADHAIFNDRAPTGAAFGYNLSTHPALARLFPPIPPSSAVVYLDRGANRVGGTLVPMGKGGLCYVDSFGIWWMSDCQGDAPWPETWSAPSDDLVGNDPSGPECPRLEEFQVILAYTSMVFTTQRTSVTSLQPATIDSPLKFTNCDGEDAKTGDLYADLDLSFLVDPDDDAVDIMAFKQLDGTTFKRGPIVEGLLPGGGCSLSSPNTLVLPGGGTLYQGRVTVGITTEPAERELPADLIRLAQTQERFHLEIPYIGFDAGRDTSLRMRFYVPPAGLPPVNARVALRMQLLGRSAGSLPQLTVTYRVLPRPLAATSLPGLIFEQILDIDTNVSVGADEYIEVQSTETIPVDEGDTILVMLLRHSNDLYTGEVGVMRPVGILMGGAL